MANNNGNNKPQHVSDQNAEIPPEIIKEWLSQQHERIELEKAETKLREKEIDTNERIAMKSMEYQARDIKAQPGEARKTIITIASVFFAFALLLVFVFLYLLSTENKEAAFTLLKMVSYVLVSALSFWAGGRSRKLKPKDIENAEVIE